MTDSPPAAVRPAATPLVDVGVPVAGRAEFVAEAVESVLAQTFTRWRLVIREDGAGNPAIEAAVSPYLDDPRVVFLRSGSRSGAAANMTQLIREGEAPFVALLHDDDSWSPEFLARRVAFLERQPQCGFVFSSVRVIDSDGTYLETAVRPFRTGMLDQEEFVALLLRGNVVPTPSLMVRRTAYERVGNAFSERLRRIYDFEMWTRLALHFPVGFLGDADASWRIHEDQSSASLQDRRADYFAFVEEIDPLVRALLPALAPSRRGWNRIVSGWLLTNGLDAVVQGDSTLAASELAHAVRLHPPRMLDPRLPAGAIALVSDGPGRRTLTSLRTLLRRRGISVHLRP